MTPTGSTECSAGYWAVGADRAHAANLVSLYGKSEIRGKQTLRNSTLSSAAMDVVRPLCGHSVDLTID